MSSPFRYFRKHTKAFMAIAAVMCMFLFVFASGTGGGRGGPENTRDASATVATWDGGSLNEGQLEALVYQRLITNRFLQMLFVEGGGKSPYYDLPTGIPMLLLQNERPDAVELEVVSTELLSSLAADAGITVSDATINYFLQEFGLKRVGTAEIRGILANLGHEGNVRSNEAIVFNTLRKLLMAYFYRRSYDDAGFVVLPAERWDDWRSVNERISLQAAALPVEKFLDQVPKPTEAQLRSLYEEHKDAEPNTVFNVGGRELPSPNPGFGEPRRVKVQYLVGSVAERTKKLLDTVTEEEIADYYERNKRLEFEKSDLGEAAEDFDNEETEGGDATESTTTPAADSATEEPSAEPAAESAAPETDGAEPSTDAAEGAGEPADAVPATEEAAPAPGEDDQSSNAPRRSPFRLTALQAEPAAGDAAAAAEPAAETDSEQSAEAAGADATEDDAAAASDAADQAAIGEASEDEAKPDDQDGAAGESAAEGGAAAEAEETIEFEPLENVRDEIREKLARDKAVQELEQAIGEAAAKLQTEYNQYGRKVVEAETLKRKAPKPPANLANLDWLAEQYGLEAKATDPLTFRELVETPVGSAVDEQSRRMNVAGAAFLTLEMYEPFVAKELEGDWYLVTKVDDSPKRVPEFDEVRDEVAAAWKRIEAAKLAEKKAEELAKEAEAATEPFDQFFAGKEYDIVKQTELFSRRSYPIGPGQGYPPELGDIPELKSVGPEIIDAAFKLDGTKTEGLLNYDHSVAYVIRLHSRQYPADELKKLFLEEVMTWPGNIDMLRERRYVFDNAVTQRLWKDVAGFEFDPEWEERRTKRLAGDE